VAFNLLLFTSDILILYFPYTFLSLSPSFYSTYSRQGPRYSDGEFDPGAIHAHVTLLREGARTNYISVASWITAADDWDD
jgi:hypothetical protein